MLPLDHLQRRLGPGPEGWHGSWSSVNGGRDQRSENREQGTGNGAPGQWEPAACRLADLCALISVLSPYFCDRSEGCSPTTAISFFTLKTPGTPLARMPAMSRSDLLLTTPASS